MVDEAIHERPLMLNEAFQNEAAQAERDHQNEATKPPMLDEAIQDEAARL